MSFEIKFRAWDVLAGIFEKTCCYFRNHYPQISKYAKFHAKKKYLHLGQKMFFGGIFELEFKKAIVIFEISTLAFE